MKYLKSNWLFVALYCLVFTATLIRQNNVKNFNCEICSDKAGYFMYLPALFYYGFEADAYPENFDHAHGDGFHLNNETNRITTKFTSGVALMLLPFYGLGVLIAAIFKLSVDGYSNYFMVFVNIGASFYLVVGLYYLKKWLHNYASEISSTITVLSIYLGTNLLYYSLDENLMSHLYSFSLLSIALYNSQQFLKTTKTSFFIGLVAALTLAILIRPTNVLFLPIVLFSSSFSITTTINYLRSLITLKNFLISLLIALLTITPQLIYWKYTFGSFIQYTYTNEGFIYWNSPKFLLVLFSPQSGFLPYTPIYFLILAISIVLFKNHKTQMLLGWTTFAAVVYMCASWSNPDFGVCNFGKRPIIEYYPILFMPLAYFLDFVGQKQKLLLYSILTGFVAANIYLFIQFDTCFFGEPWEWAKFFGYFLG